MGKIQTIDRMLSVPKHCTEDRSILYYLDQAAGSQLTAHQAL